LLVSGNLSVLAPEAVLAHEDDEEEESRDESGGTEACELFVQLILQVADAGAGRLAILYAPGQVEQSRLANTSTIVCSLEEANDVLNGSP